MPVPKSTPQCFLVIQHLSSVSKHQPVFSVSHLKYTSSPGGLGQSCLSLSSLHDLSRLIPTALTAMFSLGQEVRQSGSWTDSSGSCGVVRYRDWKQRTVRMPSLWGNRWGLLLDVLGVSSTGGAEMWQAVVCLLAGVFVPLLGHCGRMDGGGLMKPGQAPPVCYKWDKVTLHPSLAKILTV